MYPDAILGEIRMFGGNYAPTGWAICSGQVLAISQNTALFSILGVTYGGDGKTTFALPNLQHNSAIDPNITFIIALEGIYPGRS